jgi:hypothetical protein
MRLAGCAAVLVLAGSACTVFMNLDTNGYGPVDASVAQDSGCEPGIACLECVAGVNCDGGRICCLAASLISLDCEMGPTCSTGVQLCQTDVECAGGSCVHQQCSFDGGAPLKIRACGTIAFCSAVP